MINERLSLLQEWRRVVESCGDQTAVSVEGFSPVSFNALDTCVHEIAASLRSVGVVPGAAFAASLPFGIAEAAVLLASLLIGSPWVPIPPSSSAGAASVACDTLKRLGRRTVGVVVTSAGMDLSPEAIDGRAVVVLNASGHVVSVVAPTINDGVQHEIFESDVMYIMRTSGSTSGIPKFVKGLYSATFLRLRWQWRVLPFASGLQRSVVCRRSPLVFVDSVAEVFGTLLAGMLLYVPPQGIEAGPAAFIEACSSANVSRVTLVPTLLEVILRQLGSEAGSLRRAIPTLRECIVSGEPASKALLNSFGLATVTGAPPVEVGESCCFEPIWNGASSDPPMRLINLYGSTEVSADVTFCLLAGPPLGSVPKAPTSETAASDPGTAARGCSADLVPVGLPLDGARIDIADLNRDSELEGDVGLEECNPSPGMPASKKARREAAVDVEQPGNVGELIVRGGLVSGGYFHPATATSECGGASAFGTCPISAGPMAEENERFFRTGDVGFRCPGCGLLFLRGRSDNQVPVVIYRCTHRAK